MCHQCGDIGGIIPCLTSEVISDHLAPCPTGYFCMTDLYHYFDGSINIYKRYIVSSHANAGYAKKKISAMIATFIDHIHKNILVLLLKNKLLNWS